MRNDLRRGLPQASYRATVACVLLIAFGEVAMHELARAAQDGRAAVAKRAPKFLLDTPSGDTLTMRDFAGKPLVLNVFASWCPPCRQELPLIVSAARRSGSRIAFVGVDEQEAVGTATSFARQMQLPYRIGLDHGQFAASYGAVSLPITVFVDAHGIVRAIHHGALDAPALASALALIAGPPSRNSAKATPVSK